MKISMTFLPWLLLLLLESIQAFQGSLPTTKKTTRWTARSRISFTILSQTAATANETELFKAPALDASQAVSASSSTDQSISYPPTPTFRECLSFTIPALGIYICSPLMSLIDASFVGRLRPSLELAALGPASTISDSAPLPLLFLSIAATNLVAKAYAQKHDNDDGNNNNSSLARISRTAIGMGLWGGVGLACLLYGLAHPLATLYCGSTGQALVPACTAYVSARAWALPAVVVTTIAQAICIGTKDTNSPMLAVVAAGLLNLAGDLCLVRRWGIAGAAWATSVSQVLAAGLLLRVLQKRGLLQKTTATATDFSAVPSSPATGSSPTTTTSVPPSSLKENATSRLATIRQLLSFIPFLFVMTVKIGWHNSCSATAASLGGVPAAAHTALLSVTMVCMVLGDVGSSLSQAFLPAFVREPPSGTTTQQNNNGTPEFDMDVAMPTIRQLLKCTLSISASVVAFAALAIGMLGGNVTKDVAVLATMRRTLPWILAMLCFHGSAVTLEGLLLSRKMFRSLTACYSVLGVMVAASQWATRRFHLGLAGVWGCYFGFCAIRVVVFSALGGLLQPKRWWKKLKEGPHQSNPSS